ncbi:KGK domain-containing protein [Planktothrix sp. FACHB-1365]|uniref:KGK domain-containing protein n=1 Tax=Planktothrix sp. FACHB-1365 TaxID=2692855 RepID=UPI0016839EC5|nr:KGK domain-containing protein [Planktothrix sp. FACHB-1365]MBD2481278.1 KGK family protein [Planktothrix sp. FACHB-1365]
MSELFVKLEQDDDIVMLGKDTFTVSRLKELMTENMKVRLFQQDLKYKQDYVILANSLCNKLKITDKSIELDLNEIRLVFPPKGIDCQLLKLQSGKWISGKIKFQVDVNRDRQTVITELEFAPDEITSNETEEQQNANSNENLDEIRAKLNQINAL